MAALHSLGAPRASLNIIRFVLILDLRDAGRPFTSTQHTMPIFGDANVQGTMEVICE